MKLQTPNSKIQIPFLIFCRINLRCLIVSCLFGERPLSKHPPLSTLARQIDINPRLVCLCHFACEFVCPQKFICPPYFFCRTYSGLIFRNLLYLEEVRCRVEIMETVQTPKVPCMKRTAVFLYN